ncbi:MAG TPA: hydroxymethylglutaryl-CoA reductase, degradative [Sandaracinaceae bacterium]
MNSAIPRFYRLSMAERRQRLGEAAGLDGADLARLAPEGGLAEGQADRMVENAIGVFGLPLGVCLNLRVDGEDVIVPMAVEEPSVIAACSFAAKLLRAGGGVRTTVSEPIMIGQIQVLDVPDPEAAERALTEATPELLRLADSEHASLRAAGGGAIGLEVRHLPRLDEDDPCGAMMVVHLLADVRDAMGANAINSMCERLAPRVEQLTGGRVGLRILSNLSDRRTVTVEGRVPFSELEGRGAESGEELARRIEEASVFAERDPYRACTHNKGIMNGIDAALVALGQDWRAVEAGAHAFAARRGRYEALARWRVEDGHLVGRMTLPLAVGTVGGVARVHPVVDVTRRVAGISDAKRLAAVCAAAGLAQNLAALRALAAEGIQRGHMRLHARNVAVEAGAREDEVEEVARRIAAAGKVNVREAARALAELRGASAPEPAPLAEVRRLPRRPPTPPPPPWAALPDVSAAASAADGSAGEGARAERELRGKVLVTGAAGHLGANLVRHLLEEEGVEVRVLLRKGSNNAAMDGLDVERVYGDLRDPRSLAAAVHGSRYVFHAGAKVSTVDATPALARELYEHNVLGTKHLLRAAGEAGVDRVVVTGSFSAIGYDLDDRDKPGNEDMPFWPFEDVLPYVRTKVLVEHETLKACVEGLDCVIATSSAIVGPHDYKPSRIGRTLIDYAHGRLRAYVPGGYDFVSVRDVVQGHVLALKRGRTGQKYLLSTQFAEVDELLEIFEEVSGRPRPRVRLPAPVMAGVAEVSSFVLNTFFPGAPPQRVTPADVRLLSKRRRADTSKAQRELGFRPTSIRTAVHEAYADFARRGLVPARRGTAAPPARSDEERPRRESQRAAAGG